MREVFGMWKYTKMVVLVALCAAIYAATVIPFKGFVLIPGITELRPGVVFPVVFGILFGPAGAWGSAMGNLIGDFFGTLGPGTLFGFIGNFFFAYVPYKIWARLGFYREKEKSPLGVNSGSRVVFFIGAAILGSMACALIVAWSVEIFRVVPFAALATIVAVNNSLVAAVLGPPLLLILYPRIKKWDLLWTDVIYQEDLPRNTPASWLGLLLMLTGIVVGFVGGLVAALGPGGQAAFTAGYLQGAPGTPGVIAVSSLGILLLIAGSILQR